MSPDPVDVAHEVIDNPDQGRYELRVGGDVAGHLTYERSDGRVYLASTVVLPAHRGQGLAAVLVERAIGDARRDDLEVSTGCWYVRDWLATHAG